MLQNSPTKSKSLVRVEEPLMETLETSMFHPELVVKFESQFDEEIGTYRALVHTNISR